MSGSLSVTAGALAAALKRVNRVVERRSTISILSNVLLTAKGDGLEVRATDLQIESTVTIDAQVATPFATTLPAARLAAIIKVLPKAAEVSIELEPDGTAATIRCARGQWRLFTLPASDFPDGLAGADFVVRFRMPIKALARAAARIAFAICTEEPRYYLNGIYLHVRADEGREGLVAVATDGRRLGRVVLPLPEGAAGMPGIIVPRALVKEILHFAKSDDEALIEVSSARIRISAERWSLAGKTIDGTYPDYARGVPAGHPNIVHVERAALKAAVARVAAISSERHRAVKCALALNSLTISFDVPDTGLASETLDCRQAGVPIEIGLNAGYLADAIGRIESDELVVAYGGASDPMLIHEPDMADDFLIVQMPMRV